MIESYDPKIVEELFLSTFKFLVGPRGFREGDVSREIFLEFGRNKEFIFSEDITVLLFSENTLQTSNSVDTAKFYRDRDAFIFIFETSRIEQSKVLCKEIEESAVRFGYSLKSPSLLGVYHFSNVSENVYELNPTISSSATLRRKILSLVRDVFVS